jgi:hypothetical protein
MTEALAILAPVLFAAVIVSGVLGGIALKRLLPRIDAATRDRGHLAARDLEDLKREVALLSSRIERMEEPARRVGQLEEDVRFLTRLLEERASSRTQPPGL